MERALEDDKDAERPRDEGTGARREVESAPGVRPNARRPSQVPATADALGGHGSTPPPPFAMPPSPVHYRKNQSSVRKRMLAHLDHVHRTWVLATKTVRSSREYVHALLALHSGYPDLMSSALFEDHLRALGGLFRYFAHLQPEFSELSPAERQRLFRTLWVAFLSEDSDCLVPLSDNTLWAELRNTEAELAAGRSVSTAALDRMGEVGRDPGLWEGGLEPSYARFLAQTPPPSLTACLLSIL